MRISDIKLLVYDCDGVLTDNRVLVDEHGIESVFFHRGDGMAVKLIKKLGIRQIILSTELNSVVRVRAEKLNIPVIHGVENKKGHLISYCQENYISNTKVMYIGNDLNDIDVMQWCGIRGCPLDAEIEVKNICQWISKKKGGYGVIRDLYRKLQKETLYEFKNFK